MTDTKDEPEAPGMKRTLEQQFKFDNGLSQGTSHVLVYRRDGSSYEALVEIGKRGKVSILPKPTESDMYTSWYQIKGDELKPFNVIVWGARNPEFMNVFSGVVCEIHIK